MKKKGKFLHSLIAAALILSMVITPAAASEKSELEEQNEELEEELAQQEEKLAEIQENISDIEEYIEALEAQIAEIDAIIAEYEQEAAQIEEEIEALSQEIELEEENLAQLYELMKLRIQYFYENGSASTISVILESGSLAEALSALQYSVELTDYDRQQMEKIEEIIETIEEQKEEQEIKYAEVENLKAAQEEQQALSEEVKAEQEAALSEAYTEEYEVEELMEELQAEYEENKERIDEIVAEYEAALAAAAAKAAEEAAAAAETTASSSSGTSSSDTSSSDTSSSTTYSYSSSSMIWPLPSPYLSNRITSYFGYRTVSVGSSYHKGIDISAPSGTSIYAVLDGTVVASTYSSSCGYYVILYHGNGIYTHYYHQCQSPPVSVGQTVSQGQVIGYVGSTGNSSGNHLHFGISIGAMWSGFVDPLPYLGL